MHPAPSIIAFTVASGAGYGLLFLLGLGVAAGLIPAVRWLGAAALGLALGLITLGLLRITAAPRPSRAGVARALAVALVLAVARRRHGVSDLCPGAAVRRRLAPFFGSAGGWIGLLGALAALGAALTVYCTSMIYASLKPVREWHQPLVPPVYLAFALMTGALLLHLVLQLFGAPRGWAAALALGATALAFGLKRRYWAAIARAAGGPTPETATGLGGLGRVRMLEPPHTETNYLLSEMGFRVARRHAAKLRRYAWLLGFVGAALLSVLALLATGAWASVLALLAALSGIAGVLIERWLFFAEATHTVTLYYDRGTV